jgi:hypothetical protein
VKNTISRTSVLSIAVMLGVFYTSMYAGHTLDWSAQDRAVYLECRQPAGAAMSRPVMLGFVASLIGTVALLNLQEKFIDPALQQSLINTILSRWSPLLIKAGCIASGLLFAISWWQYTVGMNSCYQEKIHSQRAQ